jgi:hypothetical protein
MFQSFAAFHPAEENMYVELANPGPSAEIAALFHTGDATAVSSRALYIQCSALASPICVSILHPLYKPLQYPLLFPHGTQIEYYKA